MADEPPAVCHTVDDAFNDHSPMMQPTGLTGQSCLSIGYLPARMEHHYHNAVDQSGSFFGRARLISFHVGFICQFMRINCTSW